MKIRNIRETMQWRIAWWSVRKGCEDKLLQSFIIHYLNCPFSIIMRDVLFYAKRHFLLDKI